MPRIVIDMQGCQTGSRFRGIGRYISALVPAICAQKGEDDDIHLLFSGAFPDTAEQLRRDYAPLLGDRNLHRVQGLSPSTAREPADQWRRAASTLLMESYIDALRPDIVFCPSFFEDDAVPLDGAAFSAPLAVTLHDLIPLVHRGQYLDGNPDYKAYYLDRIERIKRSKGMLTISESSSAEAVDLLGMSPEAVVNASEAADAMFRPLELGEAHRKVAMRRFGIDRPFLFYTGGADPRKNLRRLVEAYALLPRKTRDRHRLVLAGDMPQPDIDMLRAAARRSGLDRESVRFIGYVSDDDLVLLYNLAEAFVFPSLHEGFGLPVLEAYACGIPVVASNTSSLPEIVGCEEALFDPESPPAIAQRMEAVLTDAAYRDRLRAAGAAQLGKFSWQLSGRKALSALRAWAEPAAEPDPDWSAVQARLAAGEKKLVAALASVSAAHAAPTRLDLVQAAQAIADNRRSLEARLRPALPPAPLSWRIEGPFDSSYSLSLVNRELARALAAAGHAVSLLSSEGPGDFEPSSAFLGANPDLAAMHRKALAESVFAPAVVSRNMYPPRVSDMAGKANGLHCYAWEETGFPAHHVAAFNESLQFATVTSAHVKKLLIDNGVSVPLEVVGNGVDHALRIVPDPSYEAPAAGFRFLHVSSCFPRKGVDVLLESFGRAFSAADDVALVIKTAPNPHNEVFEQLAALRAGNPDYPAVHVVTDDLPPAQLQALYAQCQVLVAPSRAEGFGLPLAEAMLAGMRVITTGWSGQTDFCTPETADLIDYSFAPARSHIGVYDSVWAEPDADHLAELMRRAHGDRNKEDRAGRKKAAAARLAGYGWAEVARRNVEAATRALSAPAWGEPRLGWVTTYGKRCGIATYSEHLLVGMGLPAVVLADSVGAPLASGPLTLARCWTEGDGGDLAALAREIERHELEVVVIQFNYAFFDFEALNLLLHRLVDEGRRVVVTLHATVDPVNAPERTLALLATGLARCDRLLVHSVHDLNRLKALGLAERASLFPHGVPQPGGTFLRRPASKRPFRIASYGFFLPDKGLIELIEAAAILRRDGEDIRLRLVNAEYPSGGSADLIAEARRRIDERGLSDHVELHTGFLSDDRSMVLLSEADIIVYPYQRTGESASGAVRHGIASGVPVAVSPLPIFDDVRECVHTLPGTGEADIAAGLGALRRKIGDRDETIAACADRARAWCRAHSYPALGARLAGMLRALYRDGLSERRNISSSGS